MYALPFLLVVYWTMTGTYLSKTITHSSTFFSLFFRQYEYCLDFLMWRFFETLTLWFYNVYIVEETSLNIIFALTPLYSSVRKGGFYITFFFLSFTLKKKQWKRGQSNRITVYFLTVYKVERILVAIISGNCCRANVPNSIIKLFVNCVYLATYETVAHFYRYQRSYDEQKRVSI